MAYVPVEQRRAQLVDAAVRVLARDGVVGATTKRIAQEAGVPVGTVHYCFGDKDELFAAVLDRLTDDLLDVGRRPPPVAPDLVGTLRAGLEALWPVVGGDRGRQSAAFELTLVATRTPGLAALARRQYATCLTAVAAFLVGASAAHGLRLAEEEAERLARWAVATVDGAVMQLLVDGDETAAYRVLDDLLAVLAAQVETAGARRGRVPRPATGADG